MRINRFRSCAWGRVPAEEGAQRWLVEEPVAQLGWCDRRRSQMRQDLARAGHCLERPTGTACLGKYAVPEPGPVLVYLAEDALLVVRNASREWRGIAVWISPRSQST